MANLPKNYFKHFLLPAGLVFIYAIFMFALWINNINKLEKVEIDISVLFKEFDKYQETRYLPSIKVLNPKGDVINLKKYNGKYTVLNIWATWCTPCLKELPALKKLSERLPYDSDWQVIAVSIDKVENMPKILAYTSRLNVSDIANYHDYNLDLQKKINLNGLPMTLIINNHGRLLYKIHGSAFWYDDEIIDFLNLVKKVH